jgi:hypothetical protein
MWLAGVSAETSDPALAGVSAETPGPVGLALMR